MIVAQARKSDEEWLVSGYILEVQPIAFAEGSDE